jgi:hypothetical protein
VIGYVDGLSRALIDVSISPTKTGSHESVEVWIDTAFNGGLVSSQRTHKTHNE